MTEVAEFAMPPAPSLTKVVDRMVSLNLVYRRPDLRDRRRVLIHRRPAAGACTSGWPATSAWPFGSWTTWPTARTPPSLLGSCSKVLERPQQELPCLARPSGTRPGRVLPANVTYPPELPVSQHRAEIAEAIRDHQARRPGPGKTTQPPKICLSRGGASGG